MKTIQILCFTLISLNFSYCQNKEITSEDLKNLFKESVQKEIKVANYVHPWRSDNVDSTYYKSDTIRVFQFKTRSYRMHLCETVNWNFSNSNELILTREHYCMEPPTRDITRPTDSLNVVIQEKQSKPQITLLSKGKRIDGFEILDVEENDSTTVLVLKRIRA